MAVSTIPYIVKELCAQAPAETTDITMPIDKLLQSVEAVGPCI
jgi:hypothetical protein